MNLFRIPLNLIVVVTLLKVESVPYYLSFYICGVLISGSFYAIYVLGENNGDLNISLNELRNID